MNRVFVPIEPVPWQAPIVTRKGAYSPKRYAAFRDAARLWLKNWWHEPLLDGPIRCDIVIVLRRPKCHYGTGRNAHCLKPGAPKFLVETPDRDNLQKAISDCGNGILWTDDKRIIDGRTTKRYRVGDECIGFWLGFKEIDE